MKRTFFLSAWLLILTVQIGWGQIPQLISYQAVLTDTSGKAVPDGVYNLTFKLYDSAGTELWSENHPAVSVSKGVFNVIFGSVNPVNLPFDKPYKLGVTVGAGPELPRIPLTAAAYSLNARSIADGAVTSSKIPSGQVVKSLNSLKDDVTLAPGSNVTITPSGNTLTISVTGGTGDGHSLDAADGSPTDVVFVDNEGLVGIGTKTPSEKVDVIGNLKSTGTIDATGMSSKIRFHYDTLGDLPSASTYHGMFAHVHAEGKAYFAHAGQWLPLANETHTHSKLVASDGTPDPALSVDANGNVGIGTTPSAKLHLQDGSVLFAGTTGTTPTSGAGARMMWIPDKRAFRAGEAAGNQWDASNVGNHSFAVGFSTKANGGYSTAMGFATTASEQGSTAMGGNTTASAPFSTAMGDNTMASGQGSTAMGNGSIASGNASAAIGGGTLSAGYHVTRWGADNGAVFRHIKGERHGHGIHPIRQRKGLKTEGCNHSRPLVGGPETRDLIGQLAIRLRIGKRDRTR